MKTLYCNLVTVLVSFMAILKLVFVEICNFCVTRFDNFGPGMMALLNNEKSKEEKKKILTYTVKNILVFGFISLCFNYLLNYSYFMKTAFNILFLFIGVTVFIYVSFIEKKCKLSNFIACVNIGIRVGFLLKGLIIGVSLIESIPIIGPLFLAVFLVINLPKVIKEEFKRFL